MDNFDFQLMISKMIEEKVNAAIEARIAELREKEILNLEEACNFTGMSKSFIYKMTSLNAIPHYKPTGKVLYFEKKELESWMRTRKGKSQEELISAAHRYMNSHRL